MTDKFIDTIEQEKCSISLLESESKPKRYASNKVECWDFIIKYQLDYLLGTAVKYVWRHKYKGGKEDLYKAIDFLRKRNSLSIEYFTPLSEYVIEPLDPDDYEDLDAVQLSVLHYVRYIPTRTSWGKHCQDVNLLISLLEMYVEAFYD